MNKNISNYEAKSRRDAANAIRYCRMIERVNLYKVNRHYYDYFKQLSGLTFYFKYLRELSNKTLLDIGAGEGLATRKFIELETDLNIIPTGLVLPKTVDHDEKLWKKYTLTPAETLKKIPDKSVGGILAVHYIAHSACMDLVVKSIDRVLIDEGIVKAAFKPVLPMYNKQDSLYYYQSGEIACDEFKALGFDVAFGNFSTSSVVLAIKNPRNISAADMMKNETEAFRRFLI